MSRGRSGTTRLATSLAALLVTLLVTLPALAAAPGERDVSFDVDKDGLKWTGPCRAVVFYAGERDESVAVALTHGDLSKPASLPAGKYELQVECPSTEGALRQTQSLVVGARDATVRVKLRPAFLLVRVVRDGKEVPAEVEITDAFGRLVQKGRDKVALPVPPGKLRVFARVDRKAAGTSRPVLGALDVTAREGKKDTPTIDTSDGTLSLTVLNNGKPAEAVAALRAPGSLVRLVELRAGEPQPVPPGTYDVVSQLAASHDFKEQIQRKVRIRSGKTATVRLSHQTGTVLPELLLEGAPLDESAGAEVLIFLPGAPQAFNTLAQGEEATLTPGRYRLVARQPKQTLDDGAPLEAEATVQVSRGRRAKARIDLTPATLSLTTSVGKEARALALELFRQGADVPFLKRATPDDGKLGLRLSPGAYRVVATLKAPQGELVTEARVFLKERQRLDKALDLDVGRAVVQVFEEGVAVPAEVLFFAQGAAAPLLSVPAGQDAYLPPGTYALAVRRKGKERSFSPIRLVTGRTLERQLELTAPDDGGAPAQAPTPDDDSPPPEGDEDMP